MMNIKVKSRSKIFLHLDSDHKNPVYCSYFSVRRQIVNVPSFIVRLDSQKHIDFSLKSPFGGGRAGRVKRRNAKKGAVGGGEVSDGDE